MAHTFDAKVQYPAGYTGAGATSNPLSFYLDCANNATLVVLDIPIAGATHRTGGAPTVNGVAMTKVETSGAATETTVEKWFAVASHFASVLASATIPGSLYFSIPNAGGVTLWGAAATYIAGAGMVSAFDVSTRKYGTTATANPSLTVAPSDGNNVVTVVLGHGANSVPTSTNVTTLFSDDPGNYTFFTGYRLNTAVGSCPMNFICGSDDWTWTFAAFKEATAPLYAQTSIRSVGEVGFLLSDSMSRGRWTTRPVTDTLLPMTDPFKQQDMAHRNWTDGMTLSDSKGAWADRPREARDTLTLADSLVRDYVHIILAEINERAATDTLDLADSKAREVRLTRAITAWLMLSDDQRRTKGSWASIADNLGLTDTEKHWAERGLAKLDVLLVYDGDTGILEMRHEVSVLDNLPLSDSVVRDLLAAVIAQINERTATDALNLEDRHARNAALMRTITSWLALSDDLRRTTSVWRFIADSLGLSDAEKHVLPRWLQALDVLLVYDASVRDLRLRRSATDAIGLLLSESKLRTLLRHEAQQDATLVFDGDFGGQITARHHSSALNSVPLSDSVVREYVKAVVAGIFLWENKDTVYLADTVARHTTLTTTVLDWLKLDDSVRLQRADWRSVADAVSLTDDQRRVLSAGVVQLDALFVYDNATRTLYLRRSFADALMIFDQEKHWRDLLQKITDTLLLTDQEKHTLSLSRTGTDALALADLTAKQFPIRWRAVSDALALLDLAQRYVGLTAALTDWLRLDDSARWQVGSVRWVTDTTGLGDQEKHWLDRGMRQLDSLFVFDSITKQIAYRRAESDATFVFDSRAGAAERRLSVSDVILLLSDVTVRDGIRRGRGALDTLLVTDTETQEHRASRFALEQIAVSDSLLREYVKAYVAGFAAVTDVLGVTDTVARETRMTRAVTEWAALDDFTRRQRSAWQSVADTTGLTDQERHWAERGLAKLDALFVYDSVSRELRLRRGIVDEVILFDRTQTERATRVVSTETVILTDNVKRQFIRQARLDDVLPLSDSRESSVARVIVALDSLLVTDRVAQLAEAFRKIVDYLAPLADSVVAEGATGGRTYTIQAFDVLDVVDNSGRRAAATRSVMDALAVGDLAGAARALLRQVADALGIADERSAALVIQRAAVDWTLLSDSRARTWWSTEILTDRIGLSDTHAAARKLTVFETLVLSDASAAAYVKAVFGILIGRSVTDTLAVADEIMPTRYAARQIQDALGVSDSTARRLSVTRFVLSALGLDDSVTRTLEHFLVGQVIVRAITDTLDVLDLLQIERQFHVAGADATSVVDRLAQSALLVRVGSDLLDLADLVPVEHRERGWGATDALVLSDRLTRAIDRVLTDQVLVTDALTRTWLQAVVQVLSGIKERIAAYLGTKASIRNPLARLLSESHLLPSRSGTRNPMARQVDFVEPYLRRAAVVDVNAAHL